MLLMFGLALYVAGQSARRKRWLFGSRHCVGIDGLDEVRQHHLCRVAVVMRLGLRTCWRQTILLGAGMLPGLCILLVYQAQAYGGPIVNAYQAWALACTISLCFQSSICLKSAATVERYQQSCDRRMGTLRDMSVWVGLAFVGLAIRWRSSSHVMLALVGALNIALYAVSVFTPLQFIRCAISCPPLLSVISWLRSLSHGRSKASGRWRRVWFWSALYAPCALDN